MFTIISSNISSWFQQKEHGFSIDTRLGFDFFLLAYRSVLVNFSFVSRSSLVAYSLVYRRPNEDRTRIKQKPNERRTKEERLSDEKLSKTRRETAKPDGDGSLCFLSFSLSQMNRLKLALIMSWREKVPRSGTDE
mgnify:CR=1 FL=1